MHYSALPAVAAVVLAAMPGAHAGLYTKSSPVIQIDSKNYDSLIAKSNYTSVVEFYAPWCGHCQNLKPAYEKAAKNLDGLAKVAAVNCDEDENKPLCGQFGVQGFPTLKIVRPGAKKGKPAVEDYQGPRTAKAIVDAVVDNINNHVKRVNDKDINDFLSKNNESAKALLFTEKGTTSALLKSLAIDFLGSITVGQVRNTQQKVVDLFGIEDFPKLVLLPGGDKDGIVYDGDLKKEAMVKFLSQAASPNPDPAPKKGKSQTSGKKSDATAGSTEPTGEAEEKVTESVNDANIQKPVYFEGPLPIPIINEADKLAKNCLAAKANTCVLAFVPKESRDSTADKALGALAELSHKHAQGKRKLFPMYEVHIEDEHSVNLLKALDLAQDKTHVIAINARRAWWRLYEGDDFGREALESWIDQIRMSEGVKRKLPKAVIVAEVKAESIPEATPEASSEPTPEATDSDATKTSEIPDAEVTPDAESISDSTTTEPATPQSGADPTVQIETEAEKPTEEPHAKDEL
ncbi:hypothetical protein BD289DRAFT_370016 [Coniella lustricola]|uniref:protein disulfide-isomerase n=1 Tax=Coniella lustricola TaxID=2025994 RepID=A0A2T3A5Y1_9PEZI|nr:hypothetical protein BD289DRAFT_370016 [Coniella lustricola]